MACYTYKKKQYFNIFTTYLVKLVLDNNHKTIKYNTVVLGRRTWDIVSHVIVKYPSPFLNPWLCDKVFPWFAAGRWFSSGTNKCDRHDIIEIVLKVALNTITLSLTP